jgi:Fur family transcriptional regulator, ferric uptake regulator
MATIKHDCKKELNQIELRATPARIAILQLLESTKEPIDVATLIEHLRKESISTDPATVFRIMNMFTQKGIVSPIQFQEGKTRYELAGKAHHHHLVCENCGKVEDISISIIPTLEKEIQNKQSFLVKRHSLEFFGLCSDCQK